MTSRGRSVDTQCYQDIWIFSASVPPSGSVSQCVLPYFLSVSLFLLGSPLAFVRLTVFVLHILPSPRCREFTCLVDPEAVNLVIHNRYQPHLFPTDKSSLSDKFIFLCMSVKGCPFSPSFVLVPSSAGIDSVCPHALGPFRHIALVKICGICTTLCVTTVKTNYFAWK